MKKIMTMLVAAAALCSTQLFAQASSCPENAKPCPKEVRQKHNARKHAKGKKQMQAKRPGFKLSPEAKAEMKKFRDAVEAYKKDKSEANKKVLTDMLGKRFDKRLEMNAKRAASMKKFAENIEKKNAELKANREAEIEKMLERIMNPPKKQARRPRKPAPKAAPQKAAPAEPAAK